MQETLKQLQKAAKEMSTSHEIFQAISTFAGRLAATSDPLQHQKAARDLQRDLKRCKIKSDNSLSENL